MATSNVTRRPARTVLGELIRQRRQTAEEFSAEAERFAREHGLNATLSPRHVQRLVAGRHSDGRPLGPPRPATQRLLELMLDRPIGELLSAPIGSLSEAADGFDDDADELRAAIAASARVDAGLVRLFQRQLDGIRQIDRQLGAAEVLCQLREQIEHMTARLSYSLSPGVRSSLAAVLVDACTLAGWQSMDQGQFVQAWSYYERAKAFAHESESAPLLAYAAATQAVMLLDAEENTLASQLMESARATLDGIPRILRAWLDGAAGEVHAANGEYNDSMRAFDSASRAVEQDAESELPFVILSAAHLARWRGRALTQLGRREAIPVLDGALRTIEPTFVRAQLSVRLDLAQTLVDDGDRDSAVDHLNAARKLAGQCGSLRLNRRRHRISHTLVQDQGRP